MSSVVFSGPGSSGVNKYFVYDAATVNGATLVGTYGRMAEAYTSTSQTGTKITDLGFSYDAEGKVTDVYESTPNSGGYYHSSAAFFPNGALSSTSSPGRPSWAFTLDAMGRFNTMAEAANCGGTCRTLISSTAYNLGRFSQITYGSGDSDSVNYDSTSGVETSYVLTMGSKNITGTLTWYPNSLLQSQQFSDTITPANAHTCSYAYDDLARLSSDSCGSLWSQTYSYDAFGNIKQFGSLSFTPTYNTKNQIINFNASYDASGNLLTINTGLIHNYAWGASNRIASIDGVPLTYDALDRIAEVGSSTPVQILYGPIGKLGVMQGQISKRTYLTLPNAGKVVYDGCRSPKLDRAEVIDFSTT